MSSNQDFGVEQFFRADEFQADDPTPFTKVLFEMRVICTKEFLFAHLVIFNLILMIYKNVFFLETILKY